MADMDPNTRNQVTLAPIQPINSTMVTMDYTTTVSPFSPLSRSHHQSNPSPSNSGAGAGERTVHIQWNHQETVELISIRCNLERDFIASKRNKALWETVASRMREKGFIRTPDQCKCKWKNLVNRYKGKETPDPDGKQCPFFEELHAVFSERAKALQRSFMESQTVTVQSRKRMKSNSGDRFSDDFSQDEGDEGDDSGVESLMRRSNSQKRRAEREKHVQTTTGDISSISSIQEMLKAFFQQQQRLEMQWRDSMERHCRERELLEKEWRQSMEKLERERLMMEREWMEREEQRKMRDEIRAENRDTLLTTLLNKLISED